jgi:hypothetical protein
LAEHPATIPGDLLTETRSARIAEYKRRNQLYDSKRIGKVEFEDAVADGWQLDRELATGIRIRREKSADAVLENQFWILLYLLGYSRLKHPPSRLKVSTNFSLTPRKSVCWRAEIRRIQLDITATGFSNTTKKYFLGKIRSA